MDMMPSGKQWTGSGISIHRISDGKIVEEWQEWDTLGV
jgi:predicted ester cyclase